MWPRRRKNRIREMFPSDPWWHRFATPGWIMFGVLVVMVVGGYFMIQNPPQAIDIFRATPTPSWFGPADQVQPPPAVQTTAEAVPPQIGYENTKQPQGILEEYTYTQRVVFDETAGKYRAATRELPQLDLPGMWPVTNGDTISIIETVENADGKWYRILIVESAFDKRYNGLGGFVLAWLIDNENVPQPPPPHTEVPATETPVPQVEPSASEVVPTIEEPTHVTQPEPTVEAATPEPTAEEPTPEPTAEEITVQFSPEAVAAEGETSPDVNTGCIRMNVVLTAPRPGAKVSFQLGEAYQTYDLTGEARLECGFQQGVWQAVVVSVPGAKVGESFIAVPVTAGKTTNVNWYEKPGF